VLALGLILRFILGYNINGFEADISCFKAWAAYTHDYGFNNMYYRDFFLDYPPGYLYVLYIIEAFRRLFGVDQYAQSYTLMIKLAPILSDIACAAALWVLARKKLGEKSALLIAFAYLFCPAVIVNSSVWGQADSFCALLLLCTLLLLWYNHTPLAAFVYGFGILSKPQMLIFAQKGLEKSRPRAHHRPCDDSPILHAVYKEFRLPEAHRNLHRHHRLL